jgi:hypothetical protein
MKFSCSHCGQTLEAGEEWLGHATDCPACGENFVVAQLPTTGSGSIAAPQPVRPPLATVSLPKKREGSSIGTILWLLIFLVFGAFNYAMIRLDESPQQVWKRLLERVQGVAHSKVAPASTSMNSDGLEFWVS